MVDSTAIAGTPGVEEVAEEQEVTQATPEAVAEVSEETPALTPSDEPVVPKKDLDALRAAEQRRQAELQAQYNAYIQQLNQQMLEQQEKLYRLETKDMAPEDKAKYDFKIELEKRDRQLNELNQRLQAQEAERKGYEEQQRAIQAAISVGIPRAEAEAHATSPNELAQYVQSFIREAVQSRTQAPPKAPKTSQNRPASPASGLLAKWDTMSPEERNIAIERARMGRLPASEL
jgi:hypothetical protein